MALLNSRSLVATCLASVLIAPGVATAANLPNGFSEFAITGGTAISSGTAMQFSPDGKLFILEQNGTIEVFSGSDATNWTRLQSNFFANTPLNVDSSDERGLLGIAFDPNYLLNRFVYVYYTLGSSPARNRIARYTANVNGDLALAGSARTIMTLEPLTGGHHNGGAIHFGPGGRLYVAVGDDGDASNSQSINTRFGKILRLNPDPDNPIPSNNPTHIDGISGTPTGLNRAIYCAGLRNPYTFAFKPGTNLMYINDVGQFTWEEINVGKAGCNFGWDETEGMFNPGAFPNYTRPIVAYHHDNGNLSTPHDGGNFTGFAITGGAFYAPAIQTFPLGYHDDYFFADFVSGWIRRYDPVQKNVKTFATGINGPVSLLVGNDGALYYLARNENGSGSGSVFRVQRDP